MAVSRQEHIAHTGMIQRIRNTFNLPKINPGDMNLNRSGSVGTEPMAIPNGKGGYNRVTEVKMGSLGKVDIPNANAGK